MRGYGSEIVAQLLSGAVGLLHHADCGTIISDKRTNYTTTDSRRSVVWNAKLLRRIVRTP